MAEKALPSPEVLRQLLRYEPETGKLFWRERPASMFSGLRHCSRWNSVFADKEAFTATFGAYRIGCLFNRSFKAHRVIWAMENDQWPDGDIDHINRDKSDNRIENLRLATRQQNMFNTGAYSNNTSGFKGVTRQKRSGKWVAVIMVGGRQKYLGLHATPQLAGKAYLKAAAELHGKFLAETSTG